MLAAIGVGSIDDLFAEVPAELRARARIDLPPGLSEAELRAYFEQRASRNVARPERCFAGAGAYPHFVPAAVDFVLQRAEFYSAYTPYQPEVSQGTLQATFEFQTLVAMLFGMEVANASMYDAASAAAEAALMGLRLRPRRSRVLVSRALHPHYRATIRTYLGDSFEYLEAPVDATGRTDAQWLREHCDARVAAVLIGYPNFFGVIENLPELVAIAHAQEALAISVTQEALALALLRPPGEAGVDIAVGEGQSFGIPLSYGGPGLGLFATRQELLRSMPGRLVGQAQDHAGRRGFVLTLATREQHIRRERATSNICTNHGLMTLAFTAYASLLGKHGLRRLAARNAARAHRLYERLCAAGWRGRFSAPFFNEFAISHPQAQQRWERALAGDLLPGVPLAQWYEEYPDTLLLCVTEQPSEDACNELVRIFSANEA
jgi:glycine dehydrogenase subunit 1